MRQTDTAATGRIWDHSHFCLIIPYCSERRLDLHVDMAQVSILGPFHQVSRHLVWIYAVLLEEDCITLRTSRHEDKRQRGPDTDKNPC